MMANESNHTLPPSLSVVAPCFNEEEGLDELWKRVTGVCKNCCGADYEIVLVDDGSSDETWSEIERLTLRDENVLGVKLSRNHGHQLALTAGLEFCRGDRILIIDADLQDPPELLPEMMRLMDSGYEVVYGQRANREGETIFKKGSATVFYRLLRFLIDIEIPIDTGDFRLISRRVLEGLKSMPEQQRFIRGMVSWLGYKQTPLIYDRKERFAGESKYPLSKMIRFAVDAITSFSIKPLRIASALGAIFGVVGLIGLAYSLMSWARGTVVPGWTSVIVTVLLLGSVQLIVTGVLGEYLGRLFMESKKRPIFVVDEVAGRARAISHDSSD